MKLKKKLIKKVQEGTHCIENNGSLVELIQVLIECFPRDTSTTGGNYKYYSRLNCYEWFEKDTKEREAIKVTDFFKKKKKSKLEKRVDKLEKKVEEDSLILQGILAGASEEEENKTDIKVVSETSLEESLLNLGCIEVFVSEDKRSVNFGIRNKEDCLDRFILWLRGSGGNRRLETMEVIKKVEKLIEVLK